MGYRGLFYNNRDHSRIGGCEEYGQLKLRMTTCTPYIFSWDRVTERRVRVSARLCLFQILFFLYIIQRLNYNYKLILQWRRTSKHSIES